MVILNSNKGVRVSDLKEVYTKKDLKIRQKSAKNEDTVVCISSIKFMENFFKKAEKSSLQCSDAAEITQISSEDFFELGEFFAFVCPHCSDYYEGNRDFYNQHIDNCFNNNVRNSNNIIKL